MAFKKLSKDAKIGISGGLATLLMFVGLAVAGSALPKNSQTPNKNTSPAQGVQSPKFKLSQKLKPRLRPALKAFHSQPNNKMTVTLLQVQPKLQ